MELTNKKILVQGLGLHGGGVATARFCCEAGAQVTVTDLKNERVLQKSLEALKGYPITFILGEHRKQDFQKADIVVKNPSVKPDSPFLRLAQWIESDLSLYFRFANTQNEYWAVTGTKGKSTTSTLLHHIAKSCVSPDILIGGNIGCSPLAFFDVHPGKVILELSSFQIGDLHHIMKQEQTKRTPFSTVLEPRFSHAVLTNILPDHLNHYKDFESYAGDKAALFHFQTKDDHAYIETAALELVRQHLRACLHTFSPNAEPSEASALSHTCILTDRIRVYTHHQTIDIPFTGISDTPSMPLVYAASRCIQLLIQYGIQLKHILSAIKSFPGLAHRMQCIASCGGITVYNDNASTIPQATELSLSQFDPHSGQSLQKHSAKPLLILGGADKNLDLQPLPRIAQKSSAIFLAPGSASDRFLPLLEDAAACPVYGPFASFDEACLAALNHAKKRLLPIVVCSPGATSFHEFEHEFQRGDRFIELVNSFFKPDRPTP